MRHVQTVENTALAVEAILDHSSVTTSARVGIQKVCRLTPDSDGACRLKRVLGASFAGTEITSTLNLTRFEPRRATAINGSLTLTSPSGASIRVVLSRLGRVRFCTPNAGLPGYDACG